MSFKDQLAADVKNVFLNANEFAETHNVKYDGVLYENIPVVLTKIKERNRQAFKDDIMQGVYQVGAVAHIALSDLNGVVPEHGHEIRIDDKSSPDNPYYVQYRIVTSDCECGMVTLELEDYDD